VVMMCIRRARKSGHGDSMSWHRNWLAYSIIIAGFVLTAAIGIGQAFYSGKDDTGWFLVTVLPFMGSVVAAFSLVMKRLDDQITTAVGRLKNANDETNRSASELASATGELRGIIREIDNVDIFANQIEALKYFSNNIGEMWKVQNVSVCLEDDVNRVRRTYVAQREYAKYRDETLAQLRSGDLQYHDLLYPAIIRMQDHRCNVFRSSGLLSRRPEVYFPKKLPFKYKTVEFTVMHYKANRRPEVLMGWDHAAPDGSCMVALLRNAALIEYFVRQFEYLDRCAAPIEEADWADGGKASAA
jgi:hypothetical protein